MILLELYTLLIYFFKIIRNLKSFDFKRYGLFAYRKIMSFKIISFETLALFIAIVFLKIDTTFYKG